ncbi:MAG: hypothetical protein RR685_10205, partial [Hungatella sp.]
EHINPESAAHNIATIFSDIFVKSLNNNRILDINGSEISTAAKKAAQVYAIVYDSVHEEIIKENSSE